MTLADLGDLGSFIGSIGVIISLVYVGFEVRRNTKALRAQTHESVVTGYMSFVQLLTEHSEVTAKGFQSSYEEFSKVSDADKLVYFSTMYALFKHFELIHAQYTQGLISESDWAAWSTHIRMHFHLPGTGWWWQLRRSVYSEDFRDYLERSTAPEITPIVKVFAQEPE